MMLKKTGCVLGTLALMVGTHFATKAVIKKTRPIPAAFDLKPKSGKPGCKPCDEKRAERLAKAKEKTR